MSKYIEFTSGKKALIAEYKEQLLDEYTGNPFIEALPNILSQKEMIDFLANKIDITKNDKDAEKVVRKRMVNRIYKAFKPLPIHEKVWNMIDELIRDGYIERNPLNKDYIRFLNKSGNSIINKNYFEIDNSNYYTTTSKCGLIIGMSGMGKTTTVDRILSYYPQVIRHEEYGGKEFVNTQLTYIKLEAPYNASIKALTLQFFMKIDDLLGTNNTRRYVVKNLSVDAMIPLIGQVANNIGLGLLVIDELQHLNRNAKQVMNYFVNLINTFGIPILFIGTPACYDVFNQEMRIARRITGAGQIIYNNMKNDIEFKVFIKGIWSMQYTKNTTKLTKEIIDVFYEKTQGISDLVIKLFIAAQKTAIDKNIEQITVELIDKVWNKEFKLIKPMVESIESNNIFRTFKYEDIRIIDDDNKEVSHNKKDISYKVKKEKRKKIKISELADDDFRKIVISAKKDNISAYDALKNKGIIKSIDEMLGEV